MCYWAFWNIFEKEKLQTKWKISILILHKKFIVSIHYKREGGGWGNKKKKNFF